MKQNFDELTPKEIVVELDKYIIGQGNAKKAVAIALRNRARRQKLPLELREEISPKNIIMIGPTGVGKTEIARRLSRLCGAPFIKVEATKFTEVGYIGRDVESMIRDLMGVAVTMVRREMEEQLHDVAVARTEERLLSLLLPPSPGVGSATPGGIIERTPVEEEPNPPDSGEEGGGIPKPSTREKFRTMLRSGELDDKKVEVEVSQSGLPSMQIFSGGGIEEMGINMGGLGGLFEQRKKRRSVSVKEAKELLLAEELESLVDQDKVGFTARERVEEMGIIFIDEIDKIAIKDNRGGVDVSREGVQRDILPIVEGSKINTKYGMVDTSHILFMAAGAFHMSKPSDLIPELQGRFPIRVELEELSSKDFERILTQPKNALITQYVALLETEGVDLEFTSEATRKLSEMAETINQQTENIGARRLHTIMELLLEEISFNAPEMSGEKRKITPEYVDSRLSDVVKDHDLSRYIL